MRPDQRIQCPLQVQAPFSLCPSSTLLRVVMALDGFDSRSRQGQTQRLMRVFNPPKKLKYWTLMRMVRSGQWDDNVLIDEMSRDVRNWLPAPADGVIHLSADKTRKDKR
ncbi:hypothetical protein C2W62_40195, partial [Candidatus Entotheonella serta]